jgi:polyribonucleotide nucleotidyltransferase
LIEILEVKIGNKILKAEVGKVARQANGAVLATYGETTVLATVCCSDKAQDDLDYVPVSVEYNEKYYAAGKIPGGFLKREGRPKDKEILVSRLIDRPIRPLLYKEFKRDIQIIPTVLSTDRINPPDVISIIASSIALSVSDIPFSGSVVGLRIGLIKEKFVINPTFDEIKKSNLDIIVAGTKEGVTMVEGASDEISEEKMLEAISFARDEIKKICIEIDEFCKRIGKIKLPLVEENDDTLEIENDIREFGHDLLKDALFIKDKTERSKARQSAIEKIYNKFSDKLPDDKENLFMSLLDDVQKEILRKAILEDDLRLDGRNSKQIRDITCQNRLLPRVHGSSLFTRGETQALVVVTLGTEEDSQSLDGIDEDNSKQSFLLHYNFPPFSVGETGRISTGRREIGHGHLAYRAIEKMMPYKDNFPYTVRLVSEVLESNGSSSMATVCGSSLALMDAGVPIKKAVAGIAMGLIKNEDDDNFVVLSDILGDEDHLGDMDFKVAGTKDGITAFQMDIKLKNVSDSVLSVALKQAKEGRKHILDIMNSTADKHANNLSKYAPRIITFNIDTDKIGSVIGAGGKTIRNISEKWNVNPSVSNDGKIVIYSSSEDNAYKAKEDIMNLTKEPEIGQVYNGIVKKITDFGAFIEFLPGKEGLCHISKISKKRIDNVKDVLSVNQEVKARIISIDKIGRISLALID